MPAAPREPGTHDAQAVASVLLDRAPNMAPISHEVLRRRLDADVVTRLGTDDRSADGSDLAWISADNYAYRRSTDWPETDALVAETVTEMLTSSPPAGRAPSSSLTLRRALPGERFPSYDYQGPTDQGSAYGDALHAEDGRQVVLAFDDAEHRLVGAAQWYYVDALNEEELDTDELMGPASVGPLFAQRPVDFMGHVMGVHSFWVAPDRRRAGVARSMAAYLAALGVPAVANFRDPLFAAFFLLEHPPRELERTHYGRRYLAWLEEDVDPWYASFTVSASIRPAQPEPLMDTDAPLRWAFFNSDQEYRDVEHGGLELQELDSGWHGALLSGTLRVDIEEAAFGGWARLGDFLRNGPGANAGQLDPETQLESELRRLHTTR